MLFLLFLFILFVKQKRETNYEIYYEIKKLINYIQLEFKSEYISLYDTSEKIFVKGVIKYKVMIYRRGEIPMHYHQIGKYIIKPLNFQSLKNEVIRWCIENEKPKPLLLRKKSSKRSDSFTDKDCDYYNFGS